MKIFFSFEPGGNNTNELHWRHALADVKSASRIYSGLVQVVLRSLFTEAKKAFVLLRGRCAFVVQFLRTDRNIFFPVFSKLDLILKIKR